jgi:hypothetical protein
VRALQKVLQVVVMVAAAPRAMARPAERGQRATP